MIRKAVGVVLVALVVLVAACSDVTSTPPEQSPELELSLVQASADIHWSRGCPSIGPLNLLALALMSHNNEDRRWVGARLGELSDEVRGRRRDRIRARAHALVDFLLKRYQAGKFRGTDAQFTALINAIYCFAGIDIDLNTAKNTELILPSDQPQTVVVQDGQAGVQLPANPVTEPTLLTVEQLPDTFSNDGFLDTKLDQYPGFILVTKQSENDAPLAKPVVVAVCASGVIPADVRSRLRLGHGRSTGFEIAAPGDAGFLNCPNQVAQAEPVSGWARVAELIMPKKVQAFQQEFGGGVGGTVTEFSPFAPVDPQLEFGGGVGGTVTEFTRMPQLQAPVLAAPSKGKKGGARMPSIVVDPCAYAPPGTPLSATCVPSVRVTTRLGTELANVPVTWDVIAGGGSVAPKTTACGAFGASAVTVTNAVGRAGICWTIGTPGSNKVRATPGVGGDAPEGVVFTPAQSEFEVLATAGVPASITILQGGALQWGVPAGSVVPIAPIVRVTDADGFPVPGVRITWATFPNEGVLSTFSPSEVLTDSDGRASTTWRIGDRYAHVLAYFYVLPDGSTSTMWSEGAVKLYASFEATTEP